MLLAGIGIYVASRPVAPKSKANTQQQVTLKTFEDKQLGVKFSIPTEYQQRPDTPAPDGQKDPRPAKNFERLNPQGLITVRYESGLGTPATLSKRPLLEYIETEIRQFFPVKYKGYVGTSFDKITVADREALGHIYSYTDSDGKPVKARLIVVAFDSDSAYYLILQAHRDRYERVKTDLDRVKDSLQI